LWFHTCNCKQNISQPCFQKLGKALGVWEITSWQHWPCTSKMPRPSSNESNTENTPKNRQFFLHRWSEWNKP
jgi:hypothetical protein